ncbi:MAG TPA: protein kinase, partial [Verrucomicrobiaceae bacterium]
AVYKARHRGLDRLVAIKILPEEALTLEGGEDAVERFKNEARSMARMNHPGIVSVYDFGETAANQFYLVMEHVDGTDVAQMILAKSRLPDEHALSITAHVCDALHYAHSHGVIHRDIKPANILLNREGQVKIADFGLAKKTDAGATGITRTNITMGTPDFIAPEGLIEGLTVDHRADVYSVGVMLYNMLTGEVPRGAFKMPSVKVGSDPRFDAIIVRAIQSEREERYQSTQEMRRDLDVILTVPMVRQEQSGRDAIPSRGQSSKVPTRPPNTGTKPVTTRSKPITTSGRAPTAAPRSTTTTSHRPAQGMVPGAVSDGPREVDEVFESAPPAKKNAMALYAGLGVLACLVIGGGWWVMHGTNKPASATASVTSSTPPAIEKSSSSATATTTKPAARDEVKTNPPPSPPGGGIPAKFTELVMVPHNQWFKILWSKESVEGRKGFEWRKDGWIDCRASGELLGFTQLAGNHKLQNMSLKAVVRPPDKDKEWLWTFREGPQGNYRLVVRADRLGLDFEDKASIQGRATRLREGSF